MMHKLTEDTLEHAEFAVTTYRNKRTPTEPFRIDVYYVVETNPSKMDGSTSFTDGDYALHNMVVEPFRDLYDHMVDFFEEDTLYCSGESYLLVHEKEIYYVTFEDFYGITFRSMIPDDAHTNFITYQKAGMSAYMAMKTLFL